MDIFQGIGFAKDYPIDVKFQENAQPVFRRYTLILYALREAVDKEIDSLIVIEPAEQSD